MCSDNNTHTHAHTDMLAGRYDNNERLFFSFQGRNNNKKRWETPKRHGLSRGGPLPCVRPPQHGS